MKTNQMETIEKQVEAKPALREVNIPFPGFYYSTYSDAIDRAEEMTAEGRAEREIEEARDKVMEREQNQSTLPFADRSEVEIDESKLVSAREFAELLYNHCDYSAVHRKVAEFYAESFGIFAREELGLASEFKLSIMVSPREYNFTTDRLFALVSDEDIAKMFVRSAEDQHQTLARIIRERFTSYDGFMSHYSNDLAEWFQKPVSEWDYNELGTLLLAFMELCGHPYNDQTQTELYELTFNGNGEEDQAIDAGVDWPKYESALAELRAEKAKA